MTPGHIAYVRMIICFMSYLCCNLNWFFCMTSVTWLTLSLVHPWTSAYMHICLLIFNGYCGSWFFLYHDNFLTWSLRWVVLRVGFLSDLILDPWLSLIAALLFSFCDVITAGFSLEFIFLCFVLSDLFLICSIVTSGTCRLCGVFFRYTLSQPWPAKITQFLCWSSSGLHCIA